MMFACENLGFLEWAVASRPHPHEVVCGDGYLAVPTAGGVLFCLIDGLGHGPEAAQASSAAVEAISGLKDEAPEEILGYCHQVLRSTRGAVLSLAVVEREAQYLTWMGVGNVEGVLLRSAGEREWLPLKPGIVGCRMPSLRSSRLKIFPGDSLILFSDGITGHSLDLGAVRQGPAEAAKLIVSTQARGTDDAMVLIARYHGDADPAG